MRPRRLPASFFRDACSYVLATGRHTDNLENTAASTRLHEGKRMNDDSAQPRTFPTTDWSWVHGKALDNLLQQYRSALRAHLVFRMRVDRNRADDLVQGFIAEKILQRDLLAQADPTKGKFRALLVKSLERYTIDQFRKDRARRAMASLDDDGRPCNEPRSPGPLPDAFDAIWARRLLQEVLVAMKKDCESTGQLAVWGVFECRLLAPTREGVAPLAYEELVDRFGFHSPEQAANALVTAKRKFKKAFEHVCGRYRYEAEQSEEVLCELIEILSRVGPLDWREIPGAWSDESPPAAGAESLDDSNPRLIILMLRPETAPGSTWQPLDLAGVLRHQLAKPLADVTGRNLNEVVHAPDVNAAADQPLLTVSDLFRHSRPPLELLEIVKRHGRKQARRTRQGWPKDVGSVIYFASIAAALVRHDQRITKLDDDVLRLGFQRMLDFVWVEAPLRPLLAEGLARLAREIS